MTPPIFVRKLSTDESKRLEAGLRSKDTFILRRSQMLLASSRGNEVPQIAENLVCGQQTVRDTIRATLVRLLGVRWQREKRWITSPDPLYQRKKDGAID